MKRIRFFATQPAFVIALTSIFLFVSCNPTTKPVQNKYDGETLFKGIFFVEGEVAKKIPEFADLIEIKSQMTTTKQNDYLAVQAKIIDDLKGKDPQFFSKFQSAIGSGDQVLIRRAIAEAGSKLRTTIEETLSVKLDQSLIDKVKNKVNLEELQLKETLKNSEKLKIYEQELSSIFGSQDPANLVIITVLIVRLVIVAIIAVVLAILMVESNSSNDLLKEKAINSIAINLKGQ